MQFIHYANTLSPFELHGIQTFHGHLRREELKRYIDKVHLPEFDKAKEWGG
jgi:hypothetical protein